uniref:Ribosomal protein S13 n=1 Tax=Chloropicon laureae TaxID=464258 RepID=A0A4D6C4G4_9CHLO|nr:ribosomal protein S13 [Chloropicon laureae]QBX98575.1 ribosomal protein S13 [Chloropicon laureae]
MAYIANVYLEENKSIFMALQDIRGLGRSKAREICRRCGLGLDIKVSSLAYKEIRMLAQEVDKEEKVETKLARNIQENIKRLVRIKSYRGRRHTQNLPSRGQRTHCNGQTRKRMDWRSIGLN